MNFIDKVFLSLRSALFASSEVQQLLHNDSVRSIRKMLDRHVDVAAIQIKGCVIIQLVNGDLQFISNLSVFEEIVDVLRNTMTRSVLNYINIFIFTSQKGWEF